MAEVNAAPNVTYCMNGRSVKSSSVKEILTRVYARDVQSKAAHNVPLSFPLSLIRVHDGGKSTVGGQDEQTTQDATRNYGGWK